MLIEKAGQKPDIEGRNQRLGLGAEGCLSGRKRFWSVEYSGLKM
jgi:hypothetical protein